MHFLNVAARGKYTYLNVTAGGTYSYVALACVEELLDRVECSQHAAVKVSGCHLAVLEAVNCRHKQVMSVGDQHWYTGT